MQAPTLVAAVPPCHPELLTLEPTLLDVDGPLRAAIAWDLQTRSRPRLQAYTKIALNMDSETLRAVEADLPLTTGPSGIAELVLQWFAATIEARKLDELLEDNLCVVCCEAMGPNNPRQLCRKTWCPWQTPNPN